MDPYLRGNLIQMLREAYKPKDLIVPPESLYVSDSMAWITEYTLIKGWMAQWLNYVLWYNIVAVDPGVLLQYFLDAPVVARHLKVSRTDPQLVSFGLMCHFITVLREGITSSEPTPDVQHCCWTNKTLSSKRNVKTRLNERMFHRPREGTF